MKCVKCGSLTAITNTNNHKSGITRRRICVSLACLEEFNTIEKRTDEVHAELAKASRATRPHRVRATKQQRENAYHEQTHQ